MTYLTLEEIKEYYNNTPYLKDKTPYEILDFTQSQLRNHLGLVASLERHIGKDLVWNNNGYILPKDKGSDKPDYALLTVDIKIGGLITNRLNKAAQEAFQECLTKLKEEEKQLELIIDSLMIIHVNFLTETQQKF